MEEEVYEEGKKFEKVDFRQKPLPCGEYENCIFSQCDFSNAALSNRKFSMCVFKDCNLSLVKLDKTAWRDIKFNDCKMLGLHLEQCNEFGLAATFENCILDHSSFYQRKFKKTMFKNSSLREVDFTGCDLSSSVFDNCDLMDAKFENSILEKTDFRTAFNYSFDPEGNRIRKAKFSLEGVTGLLTKYDVDISSR